MTSFVKGNNGLEEIGRGKIRNYASVEDVCTAIANGELAKDDLFTTITSEGITEDIEANINWLMSVTPSCASPTNMLVTQDDLSDLDVGALTDRVCTNEQNITALQTTTGNLQTGLNQTTSRVGVNETNISNLQTCTSDLQTNVESRVSNTTYQSDLSDLRSDISDKVDCSDYSSDITALTTCDACLRTDVNSKVATTTYESNCTCTNNRITALESCPGLNCTGTLVATDIANKVNCSDFTTLRTTVTNLGNCAGLDCTGTVKAICNETDNSCWTPSNTGVITMRVPIYTLSGTCLTITY